MICLVFSLVFATDLCVLLGYVSCLLKLLALQCSLCFLTRTQRTFQKKKKKENNPDHDLNLFKGFQIFSLNKNYSNSVFKLVLWIKIECISL